ncbi:hypothetical protein D9M71_461260 [compost metagenome]
MVDDVAAVDRRVHAREALQRLGGGLDEEGHEAQAHAVVLLLEEVLVLVAQVHDRLHVDFVEGSQHGHGGLGFDQTLGDLGAQAGHRHALLDAIAGGEDRRLGSRSGRLGNRSSRCGLLGFDGGNHVFLGYATALASAGNAVRVDGVLFSDLACSRREDGVLAGSSRCSSLGCRGSSCGSRCGHGGTAFAQQAQQFVAEYGVTLVLDDLSEDAIGFGQNFDHHLVGLDVDDQLVALYGVARLLVPGSDGAVSNRFREGWGFDFDSHSEYFLKNSVSTARWR